MLQTDEKILQILLDAKKDGNSLLSNFKISYPNKRLAQNSNNIFVACVSYEDTSKGFHHIEGKDLVEIVIVTKKVDNKEVKQTEYSDTKFIIKTVMKEIRRLLLSPENRHILRARPSFKNISPEYNSNFLFNRGHLLVELKTLESYEDHDANVELVNKLLIDADVHVVAEDLYLKEKKN
ncbi:hypothetical protein YLM1_1766 [Methanobrevibacter olleyae]|uniref:Uncharacterized protein n=2 Tax=Methanobrevibacter olleyae TaxID=294671 RepID=A0A126R212_METOL|nr:hypothetical protein YLM1_1766 [Methanobrevibacter olleyae]